jgi:hypothetical protein
VDPARRLVAKNPSVRHLERFFDFFPEAQLLILVRDGRSVTQSCMDTFGWSFERAARAWARGADAIERFRDGHAQRSDRWHLVRYEDLLDDLEIQMRAILEFLRLDGAVYDMDAARSLPVRGSSVFFGDGRSAVHWEPVAKDATFSPKNRWRSWPAHRLDRFDWIAGDRLCAFGYETARRTQPSPSTAKHVLLDAGWTARQAVAGARSLIGARVRPLRRTLGLLR